MSSKARRISNLVKPLPLPVIKTMSASNDLRNLSAQKEKSVPVNVCGESCTTCLATTHRECNHTRREHKEKVTNTSAIIEQLIESPLALLECTQSTQTCGGMREVSLQAIPYQIKHGLKCAVKHNLSHMLFHRVFHGAQSAV